MTWHEGMTNGLISRKASEYTISTNASGGAIMSIVPGMIFGPATNNITAFASLWKAADLNL